LPECYIEREPATAAAEESAAVAVVALEVSAIRGIPGHLSGYRTGAGSEAALAAT